MKIYIRKFFDDYLLFLTVAYLVGYEQCVLVGLGTAFVRTTVMYYIDKSFAPKSNS